MEIELSMEQQFQMRQLRSQLEAMDRRELIEAVLEERWNYLVQGNYFRLAMRNAGMEVGEPMDMSLALPESEEELIEHFGFKPTDEQVAEMINTQLEAAQELARMDIDIEAIVLGVEE